MRSPCKSCFGTTNISGYDRENPIPPITGSSWQKESKLAKHNLIREGCLKELFVRSFSFNKIDFYILKLSVWESQSFLFLKECFFEPYIQTLQICFNNTKTYILCFNPK